MTDSAVIRLAKTIMEKPRGERLEAVNLALRTSGLYPWGSPEHTQALHRQAQLVTVIREACEAVRVPTPWLEVAKP